MKKISSKYIDKIRLPFFLSVLFLILFAWLINFGTIKESQAQKSPNQNENKAAPSSNLGAPSVAASNMTFLPMNAFIELAKLANPAVVNISTSFMPKLRSRGPRDPFFDMLEEFYGLRSRTPQVQKQTALGTGFIIRDEGLIITNNHVISGADSIQVQLSEKSDKQYDAKVIGSDDRTDIALIKIEGKKFPTIQLGNSKDVEVGEWVAAFGNPFGNGHTMTKGIISAKGRDINEINKFPLLQTDAPINPGNSGGPLVNLKGQVIGVNSAIDARAQGIGFAIPIDDVKNIIPQLEKHGRIRKGYLGVGLADLDPRAASALGIKDLEGAVIAQVEKSGPGAKAGLQPYDLVIELDGKKIKNSNELRDAVADTPIGKKVVMKILRESLSRKLESKELNIVVGERPEFADKGSLKGKSSKPPFTGEKAPFNLGFVVADPTPELIKEFDLEEDVNRPIIVDVSQKSLAASSGFLPGDIVLDVNRKEVTNAVSVGKNIKKGTNSFRLLRQNSVVFVLVDIK